MGQAGHARVVRDFDLSGNTRRKAELFAAALEQPSASKRGEASRAPKHARAQ